MAAPFFRQFEGKAHDTFCRFSRKHGILDGDFIIASVNAPANFTVFTFTVLANHHEVKIIWMQKRRRNACHLFGGSHINGKLKLPPDFQQQPP